MPPPGSFNPGTPPPPEQPPRPIEVAYGTAEERAVRDRLFFFKNLVATHRLGRGDLVADPQEGR